MSIKTLFMAGGVLTLLGLTIPTLPVFAAAATAPEPLSGAHAASGEIFTLRSALDRGLQLSPELTAYSEETLAREAEVAQVSRWSNPELSLEVENVAGSGAYSGFGASETTLQLSQQLEVGKKRQLRRGVAEAGLDRARCDLELARVEVQARIARDFLTQLSAKERLKLAEEAIALAAQTLAAVEEKIAAGKAPMVEAYRFQSALAEARLVKGQAELALALAQQTMAGQLGLEGTALPGVSGDLAILPPLPAFSEIETQAGQNPELLRRQLESEARRRELALARAERFLDPTVGVGYRDFNEAGESVFLFGLSLPLPLFDRNQGNIRAASSRLTAAQAQEAAGLLESRVAVAGQWQSLAASSAEAQTLRAEILPLAEKSYEAASYGYQSGRFGVLEVLEAQRSLMEVRERYLEVLTAAQLAAVELNRLLGRAPVANFDEFTKK